MLGILNVKSQLILVSLLPISVAYGGADFQSHYFYAGALGGYASTTWDGLVPSRANQNIALLLSTPIKSQEGGLAWGVYAGHEFTEAFAVEWTYMRYPTAEIIFDSLSMFSFENDDLTAFSTKTETNSVMAKIMLPIFDTSLKLFSSAGIAGVHRKDVLFDEWRLSPTFGVGINSRVTNHLLAEISGNYTAGYGEAQLNPPNSYVPFLYSMVMRFAYCF